MKKIRKRIVIIMLAMFVVTLGGCKMEMKEDKSSTKGEQIAFLKKHEVEMTAYVKSQNQNIKTVQFDWNSVEVSDSGAFTEKLYNLHFEIFDINLKKIDGANLGIYVDDLNNPKKIIQIISPNMKEE